MSQAAWQKKVKVSATEGGTYYDLPATTSSLNDGVEMLDDTNMAQDAGYRSRIYGLSDWSVSATSNFEPGNDAFNTVKTAKTNKTAVWVKYLPDGTNGFEGKALVETFNMSGDVGALETVEISLQAAGALAATP